MSGFAAGEKGELRILSAGCSAGEEPYSINIHLRRTVLGLMAQGLRIDGIDIDSERLEMARRATYRPISLRMLAEDEIQRLFTNPEPEVFELRDPFRRGVHFHQGNIIAVDSYPPGVLYDIIFCRNVLIYFDEAALKTAIDNFAHLLRPGGLLFLGHSESIIGLTKLFQVERLGQSIAYRRTEP